jgi:hypothetical protein
VCFCVSGKAKKTFFLPLLTAEVKLSVTPCMLATDYDKSNPLRNWQFIERLMADNSHELGNKKLSLREHKKYVNESHEARPGIDYIKMYIISVKARQKYIKAASDPLKVFLPIREG